MTEPTAEAAESAAQATPEPATEPATTLRIGRAQLDVVHNHAEEGYPHEVCGILAGSRASWTVSEVVPLVNERADSPRNRYKVSGLVMMKAEQAIEASGLEVVGYYHSHPDHPSRYSDFDRDHALPNMSYPIVAVHNGQVVAVQAWRLAEDRSRMDEERVEVIDDTAEQAASASPRQES